MKRLIAVTLAAIVLTALMGPVYAQRKGAARNPNEAEDKQKREDAARIERQYKATLKRMDDKAEKVVVDPWQDMRGTDDSKGKR